MALMPDEITPEHIRERAYELWDRNHRPEGLELQFWLTAERELRAELEARRRTGTSSAEAADGTGGENPG